MIFHNNGLFHITNDSLSYLFRINSYGLPEHLHFGAPIQAEDAQALICHPGLGWGGNLQLDESDTASCPDFLPLEWSGSGRGDYRESPLELAGESSDLHYVSYRIWEGMIPMISPLPQAKGSCETLEIVLEQQGLRVKLYYCLFPTAITRRTVLENIGEHPVIIQKAMSFSMDLFGSYTMASFHGGWSAEMRRHDVAVGGAKVVNESLTGASSNRHNPGFML